MPSACCGPACIGCWRFSPAAGLVHPPHSLFDNTPLWNLLREKLHFEGIPRSLYKGHLQALGICATCYADADSVTFYASLLAHRAVGTGVPQGRPGAADLESLDGPACPFPFCSGRCC